MESAPQCLCCGAQNVETLVDFGLQPPSNRFEHPEHPESERHPLVVGQCDACGLVQLIRPMAPSMAKSRFEWLTYNEPEGHLDDLVGRLCSLPGIDRSARIFALTYKDDSTLARFKKLGYDHTYRYESNADFGLKDSCAGLESIQAMLDEPTAARLAAKHGLADLLIVRHVLEHAHVPLAFLRAVRSLVRPGGYLLFEMPDSTKFIKACDHCFVWEEHITYLSVQTLTALIASAGLRMEQTILYAYPLEDSLIAVVKNEAQKGAGRPAKEELESLLADGQKFARSFFERRTYLQSLLGARRQAGKRTAIFGAGHLAAKFANMYSLAKWLDCVIDDNPYKQRLLMPGSRLAIRGSSALETGAIDLCLLSLNPESEQRVLAKNQSFLEHGGQFLSIFALSPKAIYHAEAV